MVAAVSLRSGPQRAGLRQWRDAGCNWVEKGLPFGAGREQGIARRFPGGSRQALPARAGDGCRLRAVLSGAAGPDTDRGTSCRWTAEVWGREIERVKASAKNLRSAIGFENEMNLLLASLRRVEIRIERESITDFLKWKNRMAEYNRGALPEGLVAEEEEANGFLLGTAAD